MQNDTIINALSEKIERLEAENANLKHSISENKNGCKTAVQTYLYGYSFYKFGFKEKYLSQSEKKVPFISRYFREVNSDIFIVQKT